MVRKTKPIVHKPVFDEESILSFASMGSPTGGPDLQPRAPDQERTTLCLQLKPEVMALLQAEAVRKGKTVDQIVAKLVAKHLGKH